MHMLGILLYCFQVPANIIYIVNVDFLDVGFGYVCIFYCNTIQGNECFVVNLPAD